MLGFIEFNYVIANWNSFNGCYVQPLNIHRFKFNYSRFQSSPLGDWDIEINLKFWSTLIELKNSNGAVKYWNVSSRTFRLSINVDLVSSWINETATSFPISNSLNWNVTVLLKAIATHLFRVGVTIRVTIYELKSKSALRYHFCFSLPTSSQLNKTKSLVCFDEAQRRTPVETPSPAEDHIVQDMTHSR